MGMFLEKVSILTLMSISAFSGDLNSFSSVSGYHSSFVITDKGDLWGWGRNSHGQLGDGKANDVSKVKLLGKGYVSVSPSNGGENFVYAVKNDGTLMQWGSDPMNSGAPDILTPRSVINNNFTKVETSTYSQAALSKDGSLYVWGKNSNGLAGDGTTNPIAVPKQIGNDFATVSLAATHRMAVKQDGTLWTWGTNTCGALGDTIKDNRVLSPTKIGTGYKDAVAFAQYSTIALKTDGSLWSWGQQYAGQLGDGNSANGCRATPQQIGTGFTAIAGGYGYAMGLKGDGSVWSWGHLSKSSSDIGADSLVPKKVGDGFKKIFMGTWRAYAVDTKGSLWSWGDNFDDGFKNTYKYSAVPVKMK